jgi:hypothetical protein
MGSSNQTNQLSKRRKKMTTTTNQTKKQIDAGTFVDGNTFRTIAALGLVLVLAALIASAALNSRVGTASPADKVAAPADSIVTLDMVHALESGYVPGGAVEAAQADSIVTLDMVHALESGYRPAVQADSIITLDKWYALENGASFEAVYGFAPEAQPADSIITLDMVHALESGYTPKDSIITLDMVHAYESGYNPGE